MDKIPSVKVEFRDMPYFVCELEYWNSIGGYKGFLKEYVISIRDIKKVHKLLLKPEEFPTNEWEG